MSSSFGDKFLYFLAGAGVGGVVALLLAPQSGRETRDEISRRAQEGRDFINRKVDESKRAMEEGSTRVSKEMTSIVDKSKEEFGDLVDKGRKAIHRQKEQVAAAYEAGKEAYLKDRDRAD
jgi:gas vesicle protein